MKIIPNPGCDKTASPFYLQKYAYTSRKLM